ncbi:extracellular solute-binding protein [Paenibacillus sp. HB172176]|uniref:extracellular solute-binding protein n=1 Tax=Paenibacillus sp. HB172176 TaxID=2493690 RepID=UPI0014388B24|nr:extracellular solute-binding protein [Paenibacillus sp. HB172176]
MRKKGMATLMSVVLTGMVMLAGCGSNNNNATDEASAKPEATATGNASAKPVEINFFASGSGMPAENEDFILKELDKRLNMDLNFNVVATDYEQQLNVKIAGGSMPDLFAVSKPQLQTYAEQQLLLDLGPYLDQMPNVKEKLTEDDLNKGRIDAKLYAIPKRAYLPMSTYWIRKDWLDAVGMDVPATVEDFKKAAEAFTKNDPDKNGKNDTYGITGSGFGSPDAVNAPSTFDAVFAAFGVATPGQFQIGDNEVKYSTAMPEMKEALSYIHDLVSSGYVDPEFMTNKGLKHQEKAFMGQAGIVYLNWGEMVKDNYVEQYKAINPNAEWIQLPALTGPGGTYQGSFDIGSTGGRYAIPATLKDEPDKLNKVLEYINYITGDEGSKLVMYGIEGEHYNMEGDKVVPTDRISETSYAFNHQLTGRDELNYLKTKFDKQQSYVTFAAEEPRINTFNEFIPIPDGISINDKNRYETEEITKFIYGQRSLDEYDSFVEKLMNDFKVTTYLEQAKSTLKELGYVK